MPEIEEYERVVPGARSREWNSNSTACAMTVVLQTTASEVVKVRFSWHVVKPVRLASRE